MSRILYPAGGAYLAWNSLTLQSHDDWSVEDDPKMFKTMSNTRGELTENIEDLEGKITVSPKAFSATLVAMLQKLCPYGDPGDANLGIGRLLFPASDLPAVVHQKDGKTITYAAAGVIKPPPLTFHTSKKLIGAADLALLVGAGKNLGDSGAFATVATVSYTEPTTDPGTEVYDRYSLTLTPNAGGEPLTFTPDDSGIVFTNTVQLQNVKGAMSTTLNKRITGMAATIEFTPLDMDVDAFYSTYFPPTAGVGLGQPTTSLGATVVIAGSASGKLRLTAGNCVAQKPGGPMFSNKNPRMKKIVLGCYQAYSAALGAMFAFDVVPS